MGLISVNCPSCGAGADFDSSREFGFCSFCGTKIMLDKVIVEHRGSISFDRNAEVENYVYRAKEFFAARRIKEAIEYYNRALDIDARNVEAKNGLDMAEKTITEPNVFISYPGTKYSLNGSFPRLFYSINGQKKFEHCKVDDSVDITLPVGRYVFTLKTSGIAKPQSIDVNIVNRYSKVHITCGAQMWGKLAVKVN